MRPSFSLALFPSRADPADAPAPAQWIQCAQAAEYAGLEGLFIATGPRLLDGLGIAAQLSAHTRRLALEVSVGAGLLLPTALAASAQSLQALSGGRLRLHLADATQPVAGASLNRDQRREWSGEYLRILDHLLCPDSAPLDFAGRHFRLERAGLDKRPLPRPPLLLDCAADLPQIARYADLCLLGDPQPRRIEAMIQRLRGHTAEAGRTLGFACTLGVIVDPDEERAWAEAGRQWAGDGVRAAPTSPASSGVARLCRGGVDSPRRFEIYPNLCQPDPARPAQLVGTPRQLAARLRELHALGVEHIVLDLYPQVPQLLRFAEQVLPALASAIEREQRHGAA
ncbi:MAG: LLM class flavin-dependent oxidoreductase [Pseudomonas sp.]